LLCAGAGLCAIDSTQSEALARTDFGSNRARVRAESGTSLVSEIARASSLWVDEWVFVVPL
jgi:hypothetical protein